MREFIIESFWNKTKVVWWVHSYFVSYIDIYTESEKQRYHLSQYHTIYIDGEVKYKKTTRKEQKNKSKIEDYWLTNSDIFVLREQSLTYK